MKVPRNMISDMIDQIMVSADVDNRKAQIVQFNQVSRVSNLFGLIYMSYTSGLQPF